MTRPERLWPLLTFAALVVLPWYGMEDLSPLLALRQEAMPAVAQMLAGRVWLVPLLAAPALALWAVARRRPHLARHQASLQQRLRL